MPVPSLGSLPHTWARTCFYASPLLAQDGDVNALYSFYNTANKNVAELCNHQRATPPAHAIAMEKFDEKVAALKLEMKVRVGL